MPARAAEWRERASRLGEEVVDPDSGVLRHDGERWVVMAGNRRAVAPDLVGVRYLGNVAHPSGRGDPGRRAVRWRQVDGAGHDVVDRATLDAYRRRVAEIDEELAVAGDAGTRFASAG